MELSLFDPEISQSYRWIVTIGSQCPKCKGYMDLGSVENDEAILFCKSCPHSEKFSDQKSDTIANEVLRRLLANRSSFTKTQ
jgi:hypothetical protein